jgi:hypothetical protein
VNQQFPLSPHSARAFSFLSGKQSFGYSPRKQPQIHGSAPEFRQKPFPQRSLRPPSVLRPFSQRPEKIVVGNTAPLKSALIPKVADSTETISESNSNDEQVSEGAGLAVEAAQRGGGASVCSPANRYSFAL